MRRFYKYGAVAHAGLLTQLQYAGNIFGRAAMYAMLIFMFTRLWSYMYGQGENIIAGYSLNQMLWYVVMTELTWFSARPNSVRRDIAMDIRGGRIAYLVNKPYDYLGYILAKYAGEIAVNYGINILIAIASGLLLIGPLETFDPAQLPYIAVTLLLSAFVSCMIYLLIAMVSFWAEENAPFIWIYEKFMLILGIIFPVEIFPGWAQPLIKASPVYPSIYAPAKMTVDFSMAAWLEITRTQLLYLVGLFLLVRMLYARGVRKLNVNGG